MRPVIVSIVNGATREAARWAIDDARRRELGAALDDDGGAANLRERGGRAGFPGLAVAAWEAAGGDPLTALVLALDELERRAQTNAAA